MARSLGEKWAALLSGRIAGLICTVIWRRKKTAENSFEQQRLNTRLAVSKVQEYAELWPFAAHCDQKVYNGSCYYQAVLAEVSCGNLRQWSANFIHVFKRVFWGMVFTLVRLPNSCNARLCLTAAMSCAILQATVEIYTSALRYTWVVDKFCH